MIFDIKEENGGMTAIVSGRLDTPAAVKAQQEIVPLLENADKFLSTFDDEAASNVTFRIVLILDAVNRLAQYDPDIEPVAQAIAPLDALNATTVAEMKEQMAKMKDQIIAARKALVK